MKNMVIILLFSLLSPYAMANNALRGKNFTGMNTAEKVELQVNSEMMQKPVETGLTRADVATVIPTDMPSVANGNTVRDRILNRSINSILKSPMVMNNFFMKAAKKVEQTANMSVNTKEAASKKGEPETEHKFNFNVEAFKREARLSYSGYIDSKIEYKMQDNSIRVSVEESLSKNSKIAVTHLTNSTEQKQLLMYQLNW